MSAPKLDPSLLLSPEVKALLTKRGVTVQLTLSNPHGEPLTNAESGLLAQELEQAGRRLNHLHQLATIGEMSAGVLHEARNLLTGVVGLSLVRSGDESHLDLLRQEASRCSRLLNAFLNAASRAPGYPTPVRPADLLEATSALLNAEAKSRPCSLVVTGADRAPTLTTYTQELQQVLLNLTLNAIEASPAGGCVTLSVSFTEQDLSIHVADEGAGVAPEVLDKIFEPFFTTKPLSRGTGLGLSTSKRLVEAMRGQLTVLNIPGSGAEFTVTLPRLLPTPKSVAPGVPR